MFDMHGVGEDRYLSTNMKCGGRNGACARAGSADICASGMRRGHFMEANDARRQAVCRGVAKALRKSCAACVQGGDKDTHALFRSDM